MQNNMIKAIHNIVNAINLLTRAIKDVRITSSLANGFYYISSSAGTTCTLADTFYKILGTYGAIEHTDFSVSGQTITYNGTKTAKFLLNVSVSMIADTLNVVASYSPAVNGSVNANLILTRKIGGIGDVGSLSGSGPFHLDPGDELEIHVACDNAGTVLTAEKMLISIQPI